MSDSKTAINSDLDTNDFQNEFDNLIQQLNNSAYVHIKVDTSDANKVMDSLQKQIAASSKNIVSSISNINQEIHSLNGISVSADTGSIDTAIQKMYKFNAVVNSFNAMSTLASPNTGRNQCFSAI